MFSDGDELASDLTRQLRQATVMLKSAVLFSKELNIFKSFTKINSDQILANDISESRLKDHKLCKRITDTQI